MNHLETLANLKQAISSAKYCATTPEYKELALEAELERAEHLIDKLLEEHRDETNR